MGLNGMLGWGSEVQVPLQSQGGAGELSPPHTGSETGNRFPGSNYTQKANDAGTTWRYAMRKILIYYYFLAQGV